MNANEKFFARDAKVDAAAVSPLPASRKIYVQGSRDDLRVDLNFGNAIGRYQELGFFPDGYVGADGTLRLARQASGYVAYRHFWSPSLRSTLELSAAGSTPPPGNCQPGV